MLKKVSGELSGEEERRWKLHCKELNHIRKLRENVGCKCSQGSKLCGTRFCSCFKNGITCGEETCTCDHVECKNPLKYYFDQEKVERYRKKRIEEENLLLFSSSSSSPNSPTLPSSPISSSEVNSSHPSRSSTNPTQFILRSQNSAINSQSSPITNETHSNSEK